MVTPRAAAALLAGAMSLAACGPGSPGDAGAAAETSPALPVDVLQIEARRHLDEADRLLRAADAKRDAGDARLGARVAADVRETYVEAGRLYEAASQERNRAYASAAAARDAWATEAHERCRARRAVCEEPSAPVR